MYRKVRAWLCTFLVCIAVEKKYLYSSVIASPIKLYFMCRWLVTYLASFAFNSMICFGRSVPFESLEMAICIGSDPEPVGRRGLKHHLALGELVIKPARFKMAFCSWVHRVNPWRDDPSSWAPSGHWQRGPCASAARVPAHGEHLCSPCARPYRGLILCFVRCYSAEPNPGQINWENRSHVKHTTNKHCLFSASPPSCLIV